MTNLDSFIRTTKEEFFEVIENTDTENLKKAAEIIVSAAENNSRLHITGIGKPSYVAGYAASLISSIGLPAYMLHGTEAVHGSCGQLKVGDVVILISNSGETEELKSTANAVKNNGCRLIAITGNKNSWLGKFCEVCIEAKVKAEGGVLNKAPRNSILAETFAVQCLSILIQDYTNITPQEYIKRHPGGSLGKL